MNIVRQVQAGTEEDLLDWAPKSWPSLFLLWRGTEMVKPVTLLTSRFAGQFRARWQLYHYCTSGKGDEASLFADDGPFVICAYTREKLLGYSPEAQVRNSFVIHSDGEGEI